MIYFCMDPDAARKGFAWADLVGPDWSESVLKGIAAVADTRSFGKTGHAQQRHRVKDKRGWKRISVIYV
jgi:hypothetical protein